MSPGFREFPPMESRSQLHELIDRLPEHELLSVRRLLESVLSEEDPVARALEEADWDDEPWTEADEAAYQLGLQEIAEGRTVSLEEAFPDLDS